MQLIITFKLQKARLARIRIAKASSGAAFVNKKKAAEARIAAQESGIELDDNYREEDIFELQHHHLLRCLEKTTDREFVELEVPYNGHPKRPGSPSPLASPAHSAVSIGFLQSCCGRCCPRRYQQACGKYMPAASAAQSNQTGGGMDGTYLVEASF